MKLDLNQSPSLIYDGPLVNRPKPGAIQVLRNPTLVEFQQMMRESQFGSLRGLLGNQLLLWEAFTATAEQVRATMVAVGKQNDGIAIDLFTTEVWVTFRDELQRGRKEELEEWARWVSLHQVLRRLYPGGYRLRLKKQGEATVLLEMQV